MEGSYCFNLVTVWWSRQLYTHETTYGRLSKAHKLLRMSLTALNCYLITLTFFQITTSNIISPKAQPYKAVIFRELRWFSKLSEINVLRNFAKQQNGFCLSVDHGRYHPVCPLTDMFQITDKYLTISPITWKEIEFFV